MDKELQQLAKLVGAALAKRWMEILNRKREHRAATVSDPNPKRQRQRSAARPHPKESSSRPAR